MNLIAIDSRPSFSDTSTDAIRGYMDARGFGILVDGALLHFPVPGNALELYGLENYSYGGVGTPSTAVYRPATLP